MRATLIGLCAMLAACAATESRQADTIAGLAGLRALEQRVAAVAFRLTTANAELCADQGPQTGLALHDLAQYAPESRAAAASYFHLTDAPGVIAIAPDSPAERAGLRLDDAIVASSSGSLRRAPPPQASHEPLARAWAQLDQDLARGAGDLTVRRAGAPLTVRLAPVTGCAWHVQLVPSPALEASADGRTVSVSTALVRYAADDEDLAVVLGHEMAHNLLRHRAEPVGSQRQRERAADYVGLYLTARAGYDVSGAEAFWRRFGDENWGARLGVFTHPSPTARSRAVAAAAAEIARKKAAGKPLRPAAEPPAG